jgi:7-cyano-7-deazaguanine synthase
LYKQKKEYINMKKAVLSLSGGMDSSSLLLHLLANGYEVIALGFDYGQKHKVELQRAASLVEYLNATRLTHTDHAPGGFTEAYPAVKHQIIKLDGLSTLLNSSLVTGGSDVPEGHYEQDNMKETVVPNRNKIFSSIIQAVALSIATRGEKQECAIALGVHSGDHQIYPDCTANFRDIDMEAFRAGNWDSELVYFYTPYMEGNKYTILQDGLACCNKLGFDFDEVYSRTNTSYKPIKLTDDIWLSDYKSAASVERVEAFIKLGRPDPVQYGEVLEHGGIRTVKWDEVKESVQKVLDSYGK